MVTFWARQHQSLTLLHGAVGMAFLINRLFVRLFLCVLVSTPLTVRAAEDFLDPEVAFKSSVRVVGENRLEIQFVVAPGYYLYREQFKFAATGATLLPPELAPGKVKFDETFQKDVETHRGTVKIGMSVVDGPERFRLAVNYQGCADKGLCYPPMQVKVDVILPATVTPGASPGEASILPGRDVPANDEESVGVPLAPVSTAAGLPAPSGVLNPSGADVPVSESSSLDAVLRGGQLWKIVGLFFLAGLLLSLTPCVLPMLPILSSVIAGQGQVVTRARGLALASAYSLGMAVVYTAFGVAAGLAGEGLAAYLQNPWVLGGFALALSALALSMFGVYELQLPDAIISPLTRVSNRLPAGRFAGVFAMGGISALIVSPCVAAPLAGALVYLSQTRDVWLGGSALFALAAGMSVPLLLLGASAGALLPRAGAWMDEVKRFFGVLLLAVAIWTVQPVLPASLALGLWGALLMACAVFLFAVHHASHHSAAARRLLRRALGVVFGVCGLLQMVGAASGGSDPFQPLAHFTASRAVSTPGSSLPFVRVASVEELDTVLKTAGRPVMLDFYADWCVSCKEMERFTFSDSAVQARLAGAVLLKADVTKNNTQDRALLKRFGLFGPPGILFFDRMGVEIESVRVIGYQNKDRFLQTLGAAGL